MISVVVPCYNCDKTLSRCVDSIRQQTYQQIEIILVDDGSQDKTYELCKAAAAVDVRIRLFHQENSGLMNAWKRGVAEASGEYIIFCDSDDYIDFDMVETLEAKVRSFHTDIILYGMKMEYEDGSVIYRDNQLKEGYYTRGDIMRFILPSYFSDGSMESGMVLASRWTKLFRRELLLKNFDYLSDKISVGEDALTTFASVLSAEGLLCIKGYYPYHYMRNNDSMIGRYDELLFQKFTELREQVYRIAMNYHYIYDEQIEAYFLSNVLLCMKKEICRNREAGYRIIRNRLCEMRRDSVTENAIRRCSVNKYGLQSKVFAKLIIKEQYFAVCVLTWIADRIGMGQA